MEIVFWQIMILQIERLNFEISLIVLSCLSDMAGKKRKITNSLANSKIEQEVGNGSLKAWKEKSAAF